MIENTNLRHQKSTNIKKINNSYDNEDENEEIFKKSEDIEDIDDFEVVRE